MGNKKENDCCLMDRKGREDQSSREDQCQYQKGGWSQKGTQGGLAVHRSETKLVRSIIEGKENGSIANYYRFLLRPSKHNANNQVDNCK